MLKKFVAMTTAAAVALGTFVVPASAGHVYGDYGPPPPPPYYGPYRHDPCGGDKAAGTIGGAVVGGIIGNSVARGHGRGGATILGAIIGGLAGRAVARDVCHDRYADAYYYNRAYADAFDAPYYGRPYGWRNPYNGNYGEVTPMRDYYDENYGRECREFSQSIFVDGHREKAYGTACRNPDGTWQIMS